VHLDTNPWELGKNYPAAVAIHADPKAALPELSEALRSRTTATGHPRARERRAQALALHTQSTAALAARAESEAARTPLTPLSLVHALSRSVPGDIAIVEEVLSSVGGIRQLFPCADAKALFGMRGGGIGWGVPAALGVKLALPERPVVALVGDGSAMYTSQAFWTAARESIPVVFVVFNNGCYRILKQRVLALKGFSACDDAFVGMDLDKPSIDHAGLAAALGVPGERVEKTADVGAALARGLESGGPYLIEARIDATI
jgi:benzoylformate decarboxylase